MDRAPAVSGTAATAAGRLDVAAWRTRLREGREALRDAFLARRGTTALLREHARLVDGVLRDVWAVCGACAK